MTAMFERMVGEIAAEIPTSGQVFENHNIDYCCGGKLRFGDACRLAGVNPGEIEAEILAASDARAVAAPRDWRGTSLKDLIHFIVEVHHSYLRNELPSLARMIAKSPGLDTGHAPDAQTLRRALARLIEELQAHMKKEEIVLFPVIIRMEQAVNAKEVLPTPPFGSVRNPIWMMEQEHEAVAATLSEIRTLVMDCRVRDPQCETYRVLCQALRSLDANLHGHIHLENNILFPRAMRLESELRGNRDAQ